MKCENININDKIQNISKEIRYQERIFRRVNNNIFDIKQKINEELDYREKCKLKFRKIWMEIFTYELNDSLSGLYILRETLKNNKIGEINEKNTNIICKRI